MMEQVDLNTFDLTYRELLTRTRPKLKGRVLMTPLRPGKRPRESHAQAHGRVRSRGQKNRIRS